RARARSRDCARARSSEPFQWTVCAGRSGGAASCPTRRWRRRGRDSRSARICSSAAAGWGAGQLAGVGGGMDARGEGGGVADGGRKFEPAILGAVEEARPQRFDLGALAAIGVEKVAETAAERDARLAAEREQRVERRAAGSLGGSRGEPVEQAELERRGEVEGVVPDRDAATGSAARRGEHTERQVLDREVGVLIGRGDPAAPRG